MKRRLSGSGDKPTAEPPKEAQDTRGLEVVENDPDVAWNLWANAVAEQDSSVPDADSAGRKPGVANAAPRRAAGQGPLAMRIRKEMLERDRLALEQRKDRAFEVVTTHHPRIANTVRTLWGYKECNPYINKLLLESGDSKGHPRVGFSPLVVDALWALTEIHDAQFGPSKPTGKSRPPL